MKRRILYLSIVVIIALTFVMRAAGEVVDRIVVVVNNEVITQSEIDRMLAPLYHQYKSLYPADKLVKKLDDARQAIIAQLINDKLILGEAKKMKIEVTEKEIDAKIEEVQKRFASPQMFEQALAEQHMTLKELRERFKEQIMSRKLVDAKVGATIIITPGDVSSYYEKHASEFTQPEEVKVRNILIKTGPDTDEQKVLERVKEIDTRLKEGGDFAELAKLYSQGPGASDGGLMGFVRRGDLMPDLEDVVFSLKQGEISGVIRSSIGYHFFKVEEKHEQKTLSLAEARKMIEDAIFLERAKEKMKGWVEGLKRSAYIAFK
ncbi:MAG: peptidylprolyl isomerase [Candidatus Omnitrophica bacterium]|nr:peptidylprolyl isomerase [Candidatus Omnitrophota bacterium]